MSRILGKLALLAALTRLDSRFNSFLDNKTSTNRDRNEVLKKLKKN